MAALQHVRGSPGGDLQPRPATRGSLAGATIELGAASAASCVKPTRPGWWTWSMAHRRARPSLPSSSRCPPRRPPTWCNRLTMNCHRVSPTSTTQAAALFRWRIGVPRSPPLDGFGFVVPAVENRQIISGSFSSVKYPGRARGPRADPGLHRRRAAGGTGETARRAAGGDREPRTGRVARDSGRPLLHRIARLPASMPQYYVGHRERVATIHEGRQRPVDCS